MEPHDLSIQIRNESAAAMDGILVVKFVEIGQERLNESARVSASANSWAREAKYPTIPGGEGILSISLEMGEVKKAETWADWKPGVSFNSLFVYYNGTHIEFQTGWAD